jgi:hypothetical protein
LTTSHLTYTGINNFNFVPYMQHNFVSPFTLIDNATVNFSCFIIRCTADCGWITGHSYVTYGPLVNGASVLVFEGVHICNFFKFFFLIKPSLDMK